MKTRRLRLPLAGLLGVAVAALPAIASSETSPTIEAVNVGEYTHYWSPASATVAAGGEVTLSNPTNTNHGVEWVAGPATPACSSGVPVGRSVVASGKQWSGTCTFAQAGTYKFYCTVHGPEMTGTVTVNPNGTTTTTMTTPSTTTTTTTPAKSTTGPTGPGEPSGTGPLLGSPSLRAVQHGSAVKGSLDISKAGVGDRLEVDVFARRAAISRTRRTQTIRVGRFVRKSLIAGNQGFAVTLDANARHALKRHGRLALTVKLTLTPFYGEPLMVTRSVVQRP